MLRNIEENLDVMKEYEDERALYFVLAWLLLLLERENESSIIMDALEYSLYSVLNGRFFSFSNQMIQSEGFKKVLETAIGKMRIKQGNKNLLLSLNPSTLTQKCKRKQGQNGRKISGIGAWIQSSKRLSGDHYSLEYSAFYNFCSACAAASTVSTVGALG